MRDWTYRYADYNRVHRLSLYETLETTQSLIIHDFVLIMLRRTMSRVHYTLLQVRIYKIKNKNKMLERELVILETTNETLSKIANFQRIVWNF